MLLAAIDPTSTRKRHPASRSGEREESRARSHRPFPRRNQTGRMRRTHPQRQASRRSISCAAVQFHSRTTTPGRMMRRPLVLKPQDKPTRKVVSPSRIRLRRARGGLPANTNVAQANAKADGANHLRVRYAIAPKPPSVERNSPFPTSPVSTDSPPKRNSVIKRNAAVDHQASGGLHGWTTRCAEPIVL